MAAKVATLNVGTIDQMQQATMSYVAQGFTVSTQTADATTLFKKKEFNIVWAVIGFLVCFIPLLIYCVVYATQSDEMVIIRVDPAAARLASAASLGAPTDPNSLTWSEDRKYWWDGTTWIDSHRTVPKGAQCSEDHRHWWDGQAWRPNPTDEPGSGATAITFR